LQAVDPAYVLVQLEVSEAAVAAAAFSGRRVILNPAPYRPIDAEVLARTFLITPNETEFRQLTGCHPDDPAQLKIGADWLHNQGVRHVCVTLGSRGAWWSNGEGVFSFAAPSVQPIDTTGAGDALSGVLAAELTRGTLIESAIPLAVAAASYSTTRAGAMASYLTDSELLPLLS
jgi:ribokinase